MVWVVRGCFLCCVGRFLGIVSRLFQFGCQESWVVFLVSFGCRLSAFRVGWFVFGFAP